MFPTSNFGVLGCVQSVCLTENRREENLTSHYFRTCWKNKHSHETQLATVFLYSAHRFVFFLFLFIEVNSLVSFSFGFNFKEFVSALKHF